MGRLSDWVEQCTIISQEKFDENDISTNARIRQLFFEQIEGLEFSSGFVEETPWEKTKTYRLSLRLDFPIKTKTPYEFLFISGKNLVIPQYTITHRVYRPQKAEEEQILTNLGFYLETNLTNNGKFNPKNKRNRQKNFFEKTPVVMGEDMILFPLVGSDLQGMNNLVLSYIDDTNEEKVVAYQPNSRNFYVMPEFMNIRVGQEIEKDQDGSNNITLSVYNIPSYLDLNKFVLRAKF